MRLIRAASQSQSPQNRYANWRQKPPGAVPRKNVRPRSLLTSNGYGSKPLGSLFLRRKVASVKAKCTLFTVHMAHMPVMTVPTRPSDCPRPSLSGLQRKPKDAAKFFGWNYTICSQHERDECGLSKKAAENTPRPSGTVRCVPSATGRFVIVVQSRRTEGASWLSVRGW